MKLLVNNTLRTALALTLAVLLCCCQEARQVEHDSLVDQPASPVTSKSSHRGAELPGRKPPIALAMNDFRPLVQHYADVDLMQRYLQVGPLAYLIVDFHNPGRNALSIPIEIAADSFLTAYELLEASGLAYELHPKYASPPSILLERIEGLPTSPNENLFWAVFLKAEDDALWEYQEVGISEIKVLRGMAVGFSLTRWEYLDSVFTPLDLPRHDLLSNKSRNAPLAIQARYSDLPKTDTEQHTVGNPDRGILGCGGPLRTPAKLLPQFSSKTIEEAVRLTIKDPNKLGHLFAHKHKLGPLVSKLGGQKNTVRAVLNAANGKLPASGVFRDVSVQVHGQTVIIRGNVINGIPRLGTMYIP